MPTPTDILMFAPKELRGTVATLIGDVIEGPWNKNPVRQIDPIAQGMQDRGLPVPSGGRGSKVLKYDLVRKADREAAAKGVKIKVETLTKTPSAKDSAQTSFYNKDATPITSDGKVMSKAELEALKWRSQNPEYMKGLRDKVASERKAPDIMSRAPKDTRLPLKEKQAAEAKTLETLRKGTEDFDKKWSEWGKKNGIDPERARKAARAVWTEAAMTNAPHPTESQMKYLIALMMQKGQI